MTKFSDEAADYDLTYNRDTPAAWGFRGPDYEPGDDLIWLPKSVCEVDARGELVTGKLYSVTVPNWMAEQKGLI